MGGMSRERSLEQFRRKLELALPDTEIIEFASMSEICRVLHRTCGSEYEFKPNTLRDRKGCPICSSSSKARTHEEVAAKVRYLTTGNYVLLDEPRWTSATTAVKFQHVCGHIFECSSRTMLNAINEGKLPCRVCNAVERLTDERFISYLQAAGSYTLLGRVDGVNAPVKVRHDSCGFEWHVRPSNFIHRKTRCPKCSNPRGASKGARAVASVLEELKLSHIPECKLIKNPTTGRYLPLDFYVPSLAAAIEYDGSQHDPSGKPFPYKTFTKIQKLDALKNRLCVESNIHLLRIHHSVGWDRKRIFDVIRQFISEITHCDNMVISSEATRTEWNVQRLSKARPNGDGSE